MNRFVLFILFLFTVLCTSRTAYAQQGEQTIAVHPNPFFESVSIDVTLGHGDSLEFNLFALSGLSLASLDTRVFVESETIDFSLDNLGQGVYLTSLLIDTAKHSNRLFKNQTSTETTLTLSVHVVPRDIDQLVLYPNPSNSVIHYDLKTMQPTAEISLLDLNGKILLSHTVQMESVVFNESLDISGLPGGIYLLRVTTSNGTTTRRSQKGNQ